MRIPGTKGVKKGDSLNGYHPKYIDIGTVSRTREKLVLLIVRSERLILFKSEDSG